VGQEITRTDRQEVLDLTLCFLALLLLAVVVEVLLEQMEQMVVLVAEEHHLIRGQQQAEAEILQSHLLRKEMAAVLVEHPREHQVVVVEQVQPEGAGQVELEVLEALEQPHLFQDHQ
jgi:hypothetical protein